MKINLEANTELFDVISFRSNIMAINTQYIFLINVRQLDLYLKDKNKKVIIICDECFKKSLHIDDNFSKFLKKYKVFYFKSGIKNKI